MQKEIEVKFINVDIDAVRAALKNVGGVCDQPMRLMRRALIETQEMAAIDAFIRLRDEGDKVTLTYKQHLQNGIHAANEIETTVGDFDTTKALLEAAGFTFRTYQESRRETWRLGEVEIVIDEWPWMPPYIEIEGSSEGAVKSAAEKLGYNWGDAVFGGADVIYQRLYNMSDGIRGVIDIPDVRFGAPLPKDFTRK
ncbi:MAG: class IV adenylate cyclase [Candidatus Saccharimonas sp.]|nr:class IV adenylate cyclase [Candidatus Saccharimonas sp.]